MQFCPLSSRFRSRFRRREISRILVFLVDRYGGKVCGVNLHSCFRIVQRRTAAVTSVNVSFLSSLFWGGGEEKTLQRLSLLKGVGVSRNFPRPDLTSLSRYIADTFHRVNAFFLPNGSCHFADVNDSTSRRECRDDGMTVRRKLSRMNRYSSTSACAICAISTCCFRFLRFVLSNFINVSQNVSHKTGNVPVNQSRTYDTFALFSNVST